MSKHPSLAFNLRVDVAVVGGGVTGVTAAYLLSASGRSVALMERHRCGQGETSRTTAHVSAIPRGGLAGLVDQQGPTRARAVWDAGFAALSGLRALVRDERINCDFTWVPGVLHGAQEESAGEAERRLRREAAAAAALDIDADYREAWPGLAGPAVVFEGQARLQPLRYLSVLADRIAEAGSHVFEETPVEAIDGDGPFELRSGACRVVADHVVLATHDVPADLLGSARALPDQLRRGSAWMASGVSEPGPLGEGLYWEYGPDYETCVRVDRHADRDEICGGLSGLPATSPADGQKRLLRKLRALVPGLRITHRWGAGVVESPDPLPGVAEPAPRMLVATGHGTRGLTYGTLAGMMVADAINRRSQARIDPTGATPGGAGDLSLAPGFSA